MNADTVLDKTPGQETFCTVYSIHVMERISCTFCEIVSTKIISKIYDVPMTFASKLIHGGQCTVAIDLFIGLFSVGALEK